MIALKILGIVFLSVFAILLLALSIRVDLIIKAGSEEKFTAYVRVLGIPFGKTKKKKKNVKKKTKEAAKESDGSFTNKILELLGLPSFGTDKDDRSTVEILKDTAVSVKIIVERLVKMLSRIKLRKLDIAVISGGDDAAKTAMYYGTACSVVYPLISFLQAETKSNPKKINVDIACDFEREKNYFKLDAVISLRTVHAAWAALTILFKNIANDKERR